MAVILVVTPSECVTDLVKELNMKSAEFAALRQSGYFQYRIWGATGYAPYIEQGKQVQKAFTAYTIRVNEGEETQDKLEIILSWLADLSYKVRVRWLVLDQAFML